MSRDPSNTSGTLGPQARPWVHQGLHEPQVRPWETPARPQGPRAMFWSPNQLFGTWFFDYSKAPNLAHNQVAKRLVWLWYSFKANFTSPLGGCCPDYTKNHDKELHQWPHITFGHLVFLLPFSLLLCLPFPPPYSLSLPCCFPYLPNRPTDGWTFFIPCTDLIKMSIKVIIIKIHEKAMTIWRNILGRISIKSMFSAGKSVILHFSIWSCSIWNYIKTSDLIPWKVTTNVDGQY